MEIKPRNIEIYDIKLEKIDKEEEEIEFVVLCSKGTYIRSLCEDIAEKLGTVGYMKELERTKVGEFKLEQSITIEELEKNLKDLEEHIITMEQLLKYEEKIVVEERKLQLFLNGVMLNLNKKDGIYRIYDVYNNFIGTGIIKSNKLKRDIILNG